MYSDDFGATWKISRTVDGAGGNECQIARAPNGSLILNMRTKASIRQFAWSQDDGATWSPPVTAPFGQSAVCCVSLVCFWYRLCVVIQLVSLFF